MAKQGMARPEWTHTRPHNSQSPVPEIQGKAKYGKQKANPIISGTSGADLKVFHSKPFPTTSLLDTDPRIFRHGSWPCRWASVP